MQVLPIATINPVFYSDSYKVSHRKMEPKGTELIYSNFTPRSNKYFKDVYPNHDGKTVVFGILPFTLKFLINDWNVGFFSRDKTEVMAELEEVFAPYIGTSGNDLSHFAALHDLGYLPLIVKAISEGSLVDPNIPVLTVCNTHPEYSWLTNYIESVLSTELWKPMTTATTAREFRKLVDKYYDQTVVDHTFKLFSVHDFSYRGHSSHASAAICGAAPLLFSAGTDNIPGLVLARSVYKAGPNTAGSVPAGEHSVTTLGINHFSDKEYTGELAELCKSLRTSMESLGLEAEYKQALGELVTLYVLLTEKFPTGILSYVADSYDYWRVLEIILPILKPIITRREGRLTLRPDSGDPVEMVVGHASVNNAISVEADSLEEFLDIAADIITQDLVDTTPHGEAGNNQHQMYFKINGDIYLVTVKGYEWNRHDRSYYYYDSSMSTLHVDSVLVERTSQQKGSVEVLSDLFGYTVNDKGYKELVPQIGLIYGDGITYSRAEQIYQGLMNKGFAASNVILGIGAYSFAGNTRDSLGFAVKATYAEVDGKAIPIYKEPKTDSSKKSARGLLKVESIDGELVLKDNVSWAEEDQGELHLVFKDSQVFNIPVFEDIKKLACESL